MCVSPCAVEFQAVPGCVVERKWMDRDGINPIVDGFYKLHGWDVQTGWPTQDRLRALGLEDVHAPMVAGAAGSRERGAPQYIAPAGA